ncbi:hypothetical protein [Stella sp.]|uniref:hypothetical protein n=1 Tax=Stella sp. TaxID=2912054 RepID=UPI0035AE695B
MTTSLAARILAKLQDSVEDPIADVANALVSDRLLRWAGHEALVALAAAVGLWGVLLAVPFLPSEEWGVVPACAIILAFFAHVLWSLWPAAAALPLVWRLRAGPRRLVRLLLFRSFSRMLHEIEAAMTAWAERQGTAARGGMALAQWWAATPTDRVAWQLAERLEPRIVRHAVRAGLLALAPILLMFWSFRWVVVYGGLLDRTAHLGPFEAAIYPLAAVIDLVAGTGIRDWLKGG